MKRVSYAVFAALLALAFASTIQAQDTVVARYRYRRIGLIDSVSVNKGDWNAVYKVKTTNPYNPYTIWVVGDSGKVRRYQVEIDADHIPQLDTLDTLSFSLGPQYTLSDVCFPSQQYGYIVGYTDTCYTVETTGPSVPGKGYIWYSHNYGNTWDTVSTANMPEAFRKRPIPCLSVDFYDDMHGYVGCGCGYVLYSNTHGESWYALGDTLLPKKPPWDSVGFHIGSIPRGYHVGEGYYNHFGDWYWDIKAPNASNVYVASDNNGVFFETTDSRTFLPISEISSN
ncbi:MAG: hypothetical protein E3J71_08160 [Candidatus Stahlbacteria bacterium]|nr:MAG: hypothetical protein E3J71_08160 [Candidatus Stahlbacteria bacterium]